MVRKTPTLTLLIALIAIIMAASVMAQKEETPSQALYYDPYNGNEPPGPPPNYGSVDSIYFHGVPTYPDLLANDSGGYYIYRDPSCGKWHVANFLYSRGNSLEQFHGSILAILDQAPTPDVNIWPMGFELSGNLKQNDRWGWAKWPDSIAPNLYEIWWDVTIDYTKPHDTGDFRDTLAITIAGMAIDFNIWSSGHGVPFGPDQVYLGENLVRLSDVPGFVDFFPGISDQYQVNAPDGDPNTSRFSAVSLPGETYNVNGLILPGTTYGDRYSGSWVYSANGLQFSTQFGACSQPPNFVDDNHTAARSICLGTTVYDTLVATDPNPNDTLQMYLLSGPGTLTSAASTSPVYGFYEFTPSASGLYEVVFVVEDGTGLSDTVTVTYDITVNSPPQVTLPDSALFLCSPAEICLPVDIFDADCDVVSVTTNLGTYTGTQSMFDQIGRLNDLGATVTQVGGGAPGQTLLTAADWVGSVNSQTGVSVSLPNFVFASTVVNTGSFPSGLGHAQASGQLLGAPTDLTFTLPGPGGPDGGDGDGSCDFSTGKWVTVGFPQMITTCNGANTDFVIFTNTASTGTARVIFRANGTPVDTVVLTVPGGTAGSGMGGITLDLPDGLTFNEVYIKNISGSFEVDAFAARVAPSSTTSDICFWADTSGVYQITVTATDACGNIGVGTGTVNVTLNSAPVVNAGADLNLFVCEFEEICFGVGISDPDDNLVTSFIHSGPGTLSGGQVCFTPTGSGAHTIVVGATDDCGLSSYDTVVVTVTKNSAPVATDPQPVTLFLCESELLCHTFAATDPNGGMLAWTLLSGPGSITTAGEYCFTPDISGSYTATVAVMDSCGLADTTSITYHITINTPPMAVDPSQTFELFQCDPDQVCYQFVANDNEGGTLVWSLLDGPAGATIGASGQACFTPDQTGIYTLTVQVADSCGAADTADVTFDIELNAAPTVALGADTSLLLCGPEEICVDYTVDDANGTAGLIEEMLEGYGTIDTAANRICFTPTTGGDYTFVVGVTDDCGAEAADTIVVSVTLGQSAAIACPSGPVVVNLCAVDEVCEQLSVAPNGAAVTTSFGNWSNDQLCFTADTSGTYEIEVIAEAECGADTCLVVFQVDIGQAAQISCPSPQTLFLCEMDTVAVPVGINGSDLTVTVSPIGYYQAGNVFFAADTTGQYEITVIAESPCGTDTCVIMVDITVNEAPVAVDPTTPVDTFLCAPVQICYQFDAADANGGPLTWSRVSGAGTVTPAGLWCFNANATGSRSVTAVVTDSCGAADTVSMTYNVTINTAPTLALGNDTSFFRCNLSSICLPYTLSDPDDNLDVVELLFGSGTLQPDDDLLCFTPPAPGTYQFIVRVADECGAEDIDTLNVTINLNSPPVVNAGADLNVFECEPTDICWSASVSDPDGNLTLAELVSGPGTFDGSQICFTPTATGQYTFVLRGVDACGLEMRDTVLVDFTLNSPPVANAGGTRTSIFLCEPQELCWPAGCTDPDGNLVDCALVEGPGAFDGNQICFTPTATGEYVFVLEATDACGLTDRDTVYFPVFINSGPVCTVPNDTLIFQCEIEQVCLPAYATDIDQNITSAQIISGPGELINDEWCYTPTNDQAVTVTIRFEDYCGAYCEGTFTVEFDINAKPFVYFGNDTTVFQCAAEEMCLPYVAGDADDGRPVTLELEPGVGTLNELESEVCFTPTMAGEYSFVLHITDECGETDSDTITVTVETNTAPVANAGADQTLFVCDTQAEICWPAGCSDVDGNLTDCIFNGPGTYDGSSICFTPHSSGDYVFTLQAVDDCGAQHVDTVTIAVTVNSAPLLVLDDDLVIQLCQPEPICLSYTVDDADGAAGLVEEMESGYGALDTVANEVCFTPTTAGTYEFVLSVTDPCGAMGLDTATVTVTFGQAAQISCPAGPVNVSLCEIETVCYMLGITPATASVTTSFGTYSGGELCFLADTSGVYTIEVIAEAECGADTCELTFNVDIGQAAQIVCPEPLDMFLCTPGTECIPISVVTPGATVTVSPIGSYSSGSICFPADTSGHYELEVIATTDCGADTCTVIADITINTPPVAEQPDPAVIDTFLCQSAQICYQFTGSDVDGGSLAWLRLSGNGTVTPDGLWCFTAGRLGTFTVTAAVTDSCGAADTVSLTYNVTFNSTPQIAFAPDSVFFICGDEEICLNYTVSDADAGDIVQEALISGDATIDTAANTVCFTADTSGHYQFAIEATDACGAQSSDVITVRVQMNRPPVVDAGSGVSRFVCEPQVLCQAIGVSDPDNNLDSVYVTSGLGYINGNQLCFEADTAGVYRFVVEAIDECGLTAADDVTITVGINTPPVCLVPADTGLFQCTPTQILLPVSGSDVDGNLSHCEIIFGPGTLTGGNWRYTPTVDQTVTVGIMCIDDCGAVCTDSFTVDIQLNAKPVVDLGRDTTLFLCGPSPYCWPVDITDEDDNLLEVALVQGPGSYNDVTGEICFTPGATPQTYTFVVSATDECGAIGYDTVNIQIEYNSAPTLNPPPSFIVYLDEPGEVCFDVNPHDVDGNLSSVSVAPYGTYSSATQRVCFTADTLGEYCFVVTATDACGANAVDTVCVSVLIDECIHVQIEKTHNSYQGLVEHVDIVLNGSGKELGGFDFLIAYDQSALTVANVHPGAAIEACGWEYFTYSFGASNCGSGCPSGLLRIISIAETNNGPNHPSCFLSDVVGALATIDFLVSSDATLECQYAPVEFFWLDCGDNTISSKLGDTLWVSREVYSFEYNNITNYSWGFPGKFGAPDPCLVGGGEGKPKPIRCIDFTNGGVDIVCADSIDARADLNLNEIPFEIADAVLYSNYFVYGLSVFVINQAGQIAASDVNADGITLSVADLVYLIRVIRGDAPPTAKLSPLGEHTAEVRLADGVLSIASADVAVGALSMVLSGEVAPVLHDDAEGMELRYSFDGTNTRVLVYNMAGDTWLGEGAVFTLEGAPEIVSIEAGSIEGAVMNVKVTDLPREWSLSQNYPNPFNPVTTIEFSLKETTDWKLTIYNILGQTVERFSGSKDIGMKKIQWDARSYASGVYFYKLEAGDFSDTRKMVLLK